MLVDLDGVLRVWDPSLDATLERRYGLAPASIATAAFGPGSALLDVVTGRLTDEEWRQDVVQRLVPWCGPSSEEVVEQWSASVGAVDTGVLAVVRAARRAGWRVGLLTNATDRLNADLRRLGLDHEVDVVANSSELGVAKPDARVYVAACQLLGVRPAECVFVDDSEANVMAAALVGLEAHVHRGVRELAELLGVETPFAGR